jgi:hypothetical protein
MDRSTFSNQLQEGAVEFLMTDFFLPEELVNGERGARMPEILRDKPLLAFGALPKWGVWFDLHPALSISLAEKDSHFRPKPGPRYPQA